MPADALGRTVDPNYTVATTHFTISPASVLPSITDPVYLDGQTQAEFTAATTPIIELNGTGAGAVDGLTLDASSDGSTVQSFVINRFGADGIQINSGSNTVIGNYIGTDVTGTIDLGNAGNGVQINNAPTNIIGGAIVGARNIISGNGSQGINVNNSSNATIQGNYIGVGSDGSTDLGNDNGGIWVRNGSVNAAIGGTGGNEGNVISGNTDQGIYVSDATTTGVIIEGNIIGLSADGLTIVPNISNGINLAVGAPNVQIGGTSAAARNVISGNNVHGIQINGNTGTIIEGNYIGTDPTGLVDRGNGFFGIFDVGGINTRIGGSAAGATNVISGNTFDGIQVTGAAANGQNIEQNLIGLGSDGTTILGNGGAGIAFEAGANTASIDTNTIGNNTGDGVQISGAGTGITITENSIYANTGLGIDLNNNGVTANDGNDGDAGPNDLLNFPIIDTAVLVGGNLTVTGCAPAGATIELFEADVSAGGAATPGDNQFGLSQDYGEGETYLTTLTEGSGADTDPATCALSVDADGNDQTGMERFSFSIALPAGIVANDLITATATDASSNTSEFSPVAAVDGPATNFTCDATLYISQGPDGNTATQLSSVDVSTDPAGLISIGGIGHGYIYNGIGYREQDDYLYGARIDIPGQTGTNHIVRIGSDGTVQDIGAVAGLPVQRYNAGDVAPDGFLYLSNSVINTIYKIDVSGSVPVLDSVITLPGVPGLLDFSFHASNGKAYGIANANGALIELDLVASSFIQIGGANPLTGVGATYFDNAGNFYAYKNNPGEIHLLDTTTGIPTKLVDAAMISVNDGASCRAAAPFVTSDISGVVFEDVNYGGGAGRDLATSTGVGINGVRVELYRDNAGTFEFVSATTTLNIAGQDGAYEFTGTVADDYRVRVVNNAVDDVASTRTGFTTARGVQTFRTNASTGTAVAAPNDVGGYDPAQTDDAVSVIVVGTAIAAGGVQGGVDDALTWAPVTVGAAFVTDVDFGFNFDAIVNTNDAGIGSLRQFILNANELANAGLAQVGQTAGLETSLFMIPGAADALGRTVDPNYTVATTHFTISPLSALPSVTDPAYIDGQTQAEFVAATTPIIELDGTGAGGGDGLTLAAGSDGSTIRGLVINRFGTDGIQIDSDNHTIIGNYLGTDVTGTAALANGSDGIEINGATNTAIGDGTAAGRNIISGNVGSGVQIVGVTTLTIDENYIGTDISGNAAIPNGSVDGAIFASALSPNSTGVTIRDNLISGNAGNGVEFEPPSSGVHDNIDVVGNMIGLNVAGTTALGNGGSGLSFRSTTNLTIGGTTLAERNILSSNGLNGIYMATGVDGAIVSGNYIGTNAAGDTARANSFHGVFINGATNTSVGNGTAAGRNIISGNTQNGVLITGATATGNTVLGNYIGTDVTGVLDLGNIADGVNISSGASSNTIGGTVADARNIISGNDNDGIDINSATTNSNTVSGNYIGIDATGTAALANGGDGIDLNSATNTSIGDGTAAGRNVISGNNGSGVRSDNSTTVSLNGNYVGVDASGLSALGNDADADGIGRGVFVLGNADDFTIRSNVISATGVWHGIEFSDANGSNIIIADNIVGLDSAGLNDLGNGGQGVVLQQTVGNTNLLTNVEISGNTISGNGSHGLAIVTNTVDEVSILANNIGTNAAGTAIVPNDVDGIRLINVTNITIGDGTVASRNIISGNLDDGIDATDVTTLTIDTNTIGLMADGITAAGNGNAAGDDGISIAGASTGVTITNNVIVNSFEDGIDLNGAGVDGTVITANLVGVDSTGATTAANGGDGIEVNGASNVTIGDGTVGAGNIISGNGAMGITATNATDLSVYGNWIGTNSVEATLANGNHGIQLSGGTGAIIGLNTVDGQNIISENIQRGININSSASSFDIDNNVIGGNGLNGIYIDQDVNDGDIINNIIGLRSDGVTANSNSAIGLYVRNAQNIRIGDAAGNGNIISNIGGICLSIDGGLVNGITVLGNYIGTDSSGNIAQLCDNGIAISFAQNVSIGDNTAAGRNVILSAGNSAISIRNGASAISINDNYINRFANGTAHTGSTHHGIEVFSAGSDVEVLNNSIWNSGNIGVYVRDSDTTTIMGNSITDSADLGIDLGGVGVTVNDAGDGDAGPNDLLNFPLLNTITADGATNVAYDLNLDVPASANGYRIEFFSNPSGADPSGNGEGEIYIGFIDVAHAGGDLNFTGTFTASQVINIGDVISSTTTLKTGAATFASTSEFSGNAAAAAAGALSGVVFEDLNYGGGAGRDLATATGVGINGVRVELYRDNGGTFQFVSATTTLNIAGQDGAYEFTGTVADDYRVRVVNNAVDDVASTRTGFTAARGVQTFRTDASTGTAVAAPNDVGGYDPFQTDDSPTVTVVGTAIAAGGVQGGVDDALTWTPVTVAAADVTDVDFGFNFDAIVNTNDAGIGSLRQFILNANELANAGLAQVGQTAGLETSIFMIPGAADVLGRTVDPNYTIATMHFTISPLSALPSVTDPVYLDGQTQAEFTAATTPIVELNGTGAGAANGLTLDAGGDGSTVRGLVINRFSGDGIQINSDNHTIISNYIGTDVTGTIDQGNTSQGIILFSASNVTIGGSNAGEGNLISGNGGEPIYGDSSDNIVVQGNYIGSNAAGTAIITLKSGLVGNIDGIEFENSTNITIGGTTGATPGGALTGAGNLFVGHLQYQIHFDGTSNVVVQGNYLGVDVTGTMSLGSAEQSFVGIGIHGAVASGPALSSNILIGGTSAAARNVIAGSGSGIVTNNNAQSLQDVTIQGNYIGVDTTGNAALPIDYSGIFINSSRVTIGGSAPGATNVIAAANQVGDYGAIGIASFSAGVTNTDITVQGNLIGTDASGNPGAAFASGGAGVIVYGNVDGALIGGTGAGEANTIVGNGLGVQVSSITVGGVELTPDNVAVLGNQIVSNTGLGIELSRDTVDGGGFAPDTSVGVTANDAGDGDAGPNDLLNFPELTGISGNDITFNLDVAAGNYRIEFFSNPSGLDASGHGEGEAYVGFLNIAHPGGGSQSFTGTIAGLGAGVNLAATTTEDLGGSFGSTSEFSEPVPIIDLSIAMTVDNAPPASGGDVIYTLTVRNNSTTDDATGVQVTDLLPAGLTHVSDSSGGAYNPATGVWTVGFIPSNTLITFQIVVTTSGVATITNIAEITAADQVDPDSIPGTGATNGILVDDGLDGDPNPVDDDEASVDVTPTANNIIVSGLIFDDNGAGAGTAHNGTSDGTEAGIASVQVQAVDVGNGTVYDTATSAADGTYSLDIGNVANGRPIRIVTTPPTNYRAISENPGALPAILNPATTDAEITFTPVTGTTYVDVNFGEIENPTLTQNQSITVSPGSAVLLPHVYTSRTSGDVTFGFANVALNPASSFSAAMFRDNDCNGTINAPDAAISSSVAVTAGNQICVLVRAQADAGAPNNASLDYDLTASTDYTGTTVTDLQSNTDQVRVSNIALAISKAVRNVTLGGAYGTNNQASPGDVLEFQLSFANPSALEPAQNVSVYDQTPAYSSLAAAINPVLTSNGLTCGVTVPAGAANTAGYRGPVTWQCPGALPPSATGSLIFRVQIDP